MAYIIKGVRRVMGTFVTIAVADDNVNVAGKAILAAFDEIFRIQDLMDIYSEGSEVGILNRQGYCKAASAETRYVIRRAKYFSELTNGTFDITILPLLKLWQAKASEGKDLSEADIERARKLVDHRDIALEGSDIRFKKEGMGVTLAGVAKGFAVDRAVEVLRDYNIGHALVNGGGDIRVIGGKTDELPWKIAVRNPRRKGSLDATVELRGQAIATSGAYHRPYNDIIDPKAGKPAQEILSSTVIADKAIDADVLATCAYILGVKKGINLVRKVNGARAIFITGDGEKIEYPENN